MIKLSKLCKNNMQYAVSDVLCICDNYSIIFKGRLTQDFRLQVFFHKSVSPWPLSMPWDRFVFFRKFAEIMANECLSAHCKDKIPNFETNIPRKGISGSQSQFPHSCVCERFIPRSVSLFCWRKYVDRSWDYINRSQTDECWNWGWGCTIPRKEIHEGDFLCIAVSTTPAIKEKNF